MKKKNNSPKKVKFNIYWIYGSILAIFIVSQIYNSSFNTAKKIDQSYFLDVLLEDNQVGKVVVLRKGTETRANINIIFKNLIFISLPY